MTPQSDEHPRFVKLVRGKIGRHLGSSEVEYREIRDHDQHVMALRMKLVEEATEYLLNPSIGELIDVQAVVHSLAKIDLDISWIDLHNEGAEKNRDRGSFSEGIGMFVRSTAGPRHEGEHSHGA